MGGPIQTQFATIKNASTNSSVYIAMPAMTQQMQNVFWTKFNDPYTFGFRSVGYLLDLNSYKWPDSGTSMYYGVATEYVLNGLQTSKDVRGYAVCTTTVTALVDYAAKTIVFNFSANPAPVFMSDSSYLHVADLSKYGFSFTTTDLNLSDSYLNYDHTIHPTQIDSNPLYISLETLGFFGAHAQNLGGTLTIERLQKDDVYGEVWMGVGFALVKT
jgi:hypothetical protein